MRRLLYPVVFAPFFGPLSYPPHMPPITANRKMTDSPGCSCTISPAARRRGGLRLPFQTRLSSRTAWTRMFSSYHSTISEKRRSTAARKVASASLNASGS